MENIIINLINKGLIWVSSFIKEMFTSIKKIRLLEGKVELIEIQNKNMDKNMMKLISLQSQFYKDLSKKQDRPINPYAIPYDEVVSIMNKNNHL